MRFENFITSQTGSIHFIVSIIALILGTLVLFLEKGTSIHKLIGKFYALAMLAVLTTAFMMYNLFGKWGIFHWAALVSSFALLAGLLPIFLKRPVNNYRSLHFSFMYWSVMGLYGAFVSETLVRMPKVIEEGGIPNEVFYKMTGIGTALVMGLAVFFWIRLKPKWEEKFGHK